MSLVAIRRLIVLTLAGVCVYYDYHTGKISNYFILAGYGAGLVLSIIGISEIRLLDFSFLPFFHRLASAFLGGILPLLLMWPLFHYRIIGAGDIKLLSSIGCIVGTYRVIPFLVASIFAGGAIALLLAIGCTGVKPVLNNLVSYAETVRQDGGFRMSYRDYLRMKTGAGPVKDRLMRPAESEFHFTVPILMAALLYAGGLI